MKHFRIALLLMAMLVLTGCMASPPDTLIRENKGDTPLLSADTHQQNPDILSAALYFRYGASPYLAPEQRQIQVERNESSEKALVKALIAGPSATQSALSPLFPPETEVISVTTQGDTLFITFNEALLSRYPDEPKDLTGDEWRIEAPLRRQLCMDALTATLTEAGMCTRIQVLVYRENVKTTSMRLHAGYLTCTDDDALLTFLGRREEHLLTPHNAAKMLLEAWLSRDWETLYGLASAQGRPSGQEAYQAFDAARALTGFSLEAGTVSADGQRAVVTARMYLQGEGMDTELAGYPILLIREGGLWKMDYARLDAMMNQD